MVIKRSRAAEREEDELDFPITTTAKDKEEDIMADQEEMELPVGGKTFGDLYKPARCKDVTKIVASLGNNITFKIDHLFLSSLASFHGLPSEDVLSYLEEFSDKCSTYQLVGIFEEIMKMKYFPFTLKEKAKEWFKNLGIIFHTWEDIEHQLLNQFYSISQTNNIRKSIMLFSQGDESFSDSWDRYKDFIRKCPHHGLTKPWLGQIFYEGINDISRNKLDMRCNGSFLDIHENDLFNIIEKVSENDLHNNLISRHGRNRLGGILHIQGMEQKIEMEGIKKSLGKIKIFFEVLTDLLKAYLLKSSMPNPQNSSSLFVLVMIIFRENAKKRRQRKFKP